MKDFVVCVSALFLAACGSSNSTFNGTSAESETKQVRASVKECPGNNGMSHSDLFGNYETLVAQAVVEQHPHAPRSIMGHIAENEDIHLRWVEEGGRCVIWYQGSTIFEGSSYDFEGKCEAVRDGQGPGGYDDWKPSSCKAQSLNDEQNS